jgi:HEXXH motif-containing protein
MAIGRTLHGLTEVDLAALANARYTPDIIRRLQSAQFSRNALLIEALRRAVAATGDTETADVIETATLLLSEIQADRPELVRRLLVLPQFGLWAADCLIKLQNAAGHGHILEPETQHELGYVAAFAATAGLLAGRSFDVRLPVRDGIAYLPALAWVRLDSSSDATWAQIRSEGGGTAIVTEDGRRPVLFRLDRAKERAAGWTSASRLRVGSRGLSLNVALDNSDPFLSRLGPVSSSLSHESIQAWRHGLRQAWQVLAREDQIFARALAAGLTTIVPLRQASGGPSTSAASGWAWGAIALTLPPDPLTFADTLIHEFQHLVLAAVEDIVPLAKGDDEDVFYSPWRDDPRPFSGVLQGAYAFFGVADFWRKLCYARSPTARRRAETNFAMRRRNVSDALAIVAESGKLTDTGQVFVRAMRKRSVEWLTDPVPAQAEMFAREISLEHQLRWRLANLSPNQQVIDSLARAWLGTPSSAPRQLDVPTTLTPSPTPRLIDRSSLLERCSTSSTEPTPTGVANADGPGDQAFIRGDMVEARIAYVRCLGQGENRDAWIGLVLVLRRMGALGDSWPVRQRIEVVAAISERVRAITGHSPDPQILLMWARSTWAEKAPSKS